MGSSGGHWLGAGDSGRTGNIVLWGRAEAAQPGGDPCRGLVAFRPLKGCRDRENRYFILTPESGEWITERTLPCCGFWCLPPPKAWWAGLCPLLASHFKPVALSSGWTLESHVSFLKILLPESHPRSHRWFSSHSEGKHKISIHYSQISFPWATGVG